MRCIACGSETVTERPEHTAQGYRRFRCRRCGKQFNERTGNLLNRTQYPSDVIALVVLWRLRYKLALRDLAEMFLVRGMVFSHEAVRAWEAKLTPTLAENLRRRRHDKAGRSWYVDETYLKVQGRWCYLYRAIDRSGALVDVMLSERRDMAAAKAFFRSAKAVTRVTPDRVTTDGQGLSGISCAGHGLVILGSGELEAIFEQDRELGPGHAPFLGRHSPFALGQVQDQIEQLEGGLVAGEVAAGADGPAQLGVQGLDSIGGVDDPADIGREGEERDHRRPVAPPGQGDRRISAAPLAGGEGLQRRGTCIGVLGLCRPPSGRPRPPCGPCRVRGTVATGRVSPQHKASELRIRCTMQVWTWACGNTAVIASGKPFRPSTTAMSTSSTPRFLSSVMTLSQNFAPAGSARSVSEAAVRRAHRGRLLDPQAEDLFAAIGPRAQSPGGMSAKLTAARTPSAR